MYGEDLALIQHQGYSDFARGVGPGVLALLKGAHRRRPVAEAKVGPRRQGSGADRSNLVVDLGCGAGVFGAQLISAGYSVLGVDVSEALLRIARKNAPAAKLRKESAHTAVLPRCVAVTALGEVLGYCDSSGKRPPLLPLMRRVYSALEPGGVFVFDLIVEGTKPLAGRSWREHPDWAILVEVVEGEPRLRRLRRNVVTFVRAGRVYRRREETHLVKVESQAEVLAALRSVGFRARSAGAYGNFKLFTRRRAFIAHKPLSA